MRGDTTTENEVETDGHGEEAVAYPAFGERRPSIVKLQNMLKKVSQSPFHAQYKALVSSTSESSGSSGIDSQNKQDGDFISDLSAAATDVTDNDIRQNGFKTEDNHLSPPVAKNGDLARTNPFYAYYLESGSKGHGTEDTGKKTSKVDLNTIFVPPPAFQSSPLDLPAKMNTVENGTEFSEPQKDLFQALNRTQDCFQTSSLPQNVSANSHLQDVTLNSPDLFKGTQNLTKTSSLKNSDLFKDELTSLFQAAKGEDLLNAERTRETNLFDKSPSFCANPFTSPSKKDDLFWSPKPAVGNPFDAANTSDTDLFKGTLSEGREPFSISGNKHNPSTKEDLFAVSSSKSLDIFSPSSVNLVDPFPSPITRDLFQDVSSLDDPFGDTPSKQFDPFQDASNGTLDIFQPLPSLPSEKKVDVLSSPDLFKAIPSESQPAVRPKLPKRPHDIVLTTPQGTKHDILQPTPFSQTNNLSVSPNQSPADMNHVSVFRRPPKPLPRTRAPRREKPPKPEKPPTPAASITPEPAVPKTFPKPAPRPLPKPKPVFPRKLKTPESKPVDPENYVVFEDILLIGQEKCVEDWPEDSPQLSPDFRPSGTLRLRRESLKMKGDSDGEDQDGKKKDKKFKMSLLSRRGSKEKFDDSKEGRSRTLPNQRKSSKEYLSDVNMTGENEDVEQNGWMDYKKTPLKTKVNQLLRRASTLSSMSERNHVNEHLPQESKDDDISKKSIGKENSIRQWSEGTVLDDSTGEEEEDGGEGKHEEADSSGSKKKKKMKIKFVPHRGFAITVEKPDDEPKGAHGYTPRKGSKDKSHDEVFGTYTPRKKSQDAAFEDVEELKSQNLQSTSKAAFMDEELFQKNLHTSAAPNGHVDPYGTEDCKPKKPTKLKLPHLNRRSSKEDMLDDTSPQKKKSSFSAEELDDDELYGMEDCKPKKSKHKAPVPIPRKSKSDPIEFCHQTPQQTCCDAFAEDDISQTEKKDFMSLGEIYDSDQDELETCKPQKKTSKLKVLRKLKSKSKIRVQSEDPPGATSSDYLSEAAKAEWLAAQMDERAMADLEDEDEEGDTDSLMEWWYTVEQWDEVPSDEEDKVMKEDESKSFTILADKVHRGLRVFNKVFTERAEVLWQSIIMLHAIADDISNFHQKAKIAGITGGTTTAVGGVTAIAGLALAPFTFGASLVITAVGVGVATAGGITSASAAISDNVNNMHDRKKVEVVLEEYEAHLLDIRKILHFVNQGLYKLRGHPFLRSGTQHYSEDWEIRRAVQMISLVDSPIMRAVDITDSAVASVQRLFKGMDKYFIKDSRELKKGCKKEVVGQIKEVANVLNDGIVELNAIREELQEATGTV